MNVRVKFEMTLRRFLLGLALLCIALFVIFRFSHLSSLPSGFFVDESSIALNAYSIMVSGKDEHGTPWPLYFEAFGDYKNPIFIYSVIPLFWLLGVSIETVRLTAAIWGGAAIAVFAFFLYQVKASRTVMIVSLLLLVTNPWFFQLSRVAFEVAAFPFFLFLAVLSYFMVSASKSKKALPLYAWGAVFVLSLIFLFYSYTAARVLAPALLLIGVALVARKVGVVGVVGALALFVIGILPVIHWELANQGTLLSRYSVVGLSNYTSSTAEFITTALGNYVKHFSPYFLLDGGDKNLRHVPLPPGPFDISVLFLVGIGIAYRIVRKRNAFTWWLLAGLLLSPVPSALTIQSPHNLRAIGMLVFLLVFAWAGIRWCAHDKYGGKIFLYGCIVMVVMQSLYFLHSYTSRYARASRPWFDAGTVEALEYAIGKNEPVFVSTKLYPGTYATMEFLDAKRRYELPNAFFSKVTYIDPQVDGFLQPGLYVLDSDSCTAVTQTSQGKILLSSDGTCVVKE